MVWSAANTNYFGKVSSRFLAEGRYPRALWKMSEHSCYRSILELNGNCPFVVFAGESQDKEPAQLGEGRENIPPTSQSTTKKRRKLFQKPSSVASLLSPATVTVS